MLRFFDMFGRSSELTALDEALKGAGLHPLLIPEPVKLAMLRLLRRHDATDGKREAAQLLAYCVLEHAQFVAANGSEAADHADQRVAAATDGGDTLDSKLILLALHSGVISADMADRFDIADTEPDGPASQ